MFRNALNALNWVDQPLDPDAVRAGNVCVGVRGEGLRKPSHAVAARVGMLPPGLWASPASANSLSSAGSGAADLSMARARRRFRHWWAVQPNTIHGKGHGGLMTSVL